MYSQRFKCTTHEPLILFKKAKTEQSTETLEYIPGSLFRGVVANYLFNEKATTDGIDALIDDLIFNGSVWFGDAHLIINEQRSCPIPLAIHKYQSCPDGAMPYVNLSKIEAPILKHKQLREGYFIEEGGEYVYQSPSRSERMKAARSLDHRASEEGGMYLYRYLEPEQSFEFSVQAKDESHIQKIAKCFIGNIYLGKSKTSEFGGKIKIEPIEDNKEFLPSEAVVFVKTLYAASNWCFLNEFGSYTAQINAEMICGNQDAEIDWQHTFLRFRTYAPYNTHRNAFDAQRLIIEKGSVVTFKDAVEIKEQFLSSRIGVHKTEGFGEVVFNLNILNHDTFNLSKKETEIGIEETTASSPLLNILIKRKEDKIQLVSDFEKANEAVDNKTYDFKIGKAQWGNVLRKCLSKASLDQIKYELFENDKTKLDKNLKTAKWKLEDIENLKKVLKECGNPQAFGIFVKQKINQLKNE
jgi:CRISPR-associated protein Csx10